MLELTNLNILEILHGIKIKKQENLKRYEKKVCLDYFLLALFPKN